MDEKKLKMAINKLRKRYGDDVVYPLKNKKIKTNVKRWSSSFDEFDNMLDGGIPKSRIIELSGSEGAGKTSFCLAISANSDFTVFIDSEGTLDEDRAIQLGAKEKRFIIQRPESGEETCEAIVEFAKSKVGLIIIDSVPSIVPFTFLQKMDKKGFLTDNIAGTARLLSLKLFPSLIPALRDSPTTVIFINQVRERIGIFFGSPTITPGGRALKHYTALRIQMRRRAWYGKINERIGQLCAFRVVKSKISCPYQECEIPLHFEKGFISLKEMKKLMKSKKGK